MELEVGNAAVKEPGVGPGCGELVGEGLVVVGELADALLERGVLGDQPLQAVVGPGLFQVADLAQEVGDALALLNNLAVGGGEGVLGVEGAFAPGRVVLVAVAAGLPIDVALCG